MLLTPRRAPIPVEGFLAQLLTVKDRGVGMHLRMVEHATKGGFKYGPTYGNAFGVKLDHTLAEDHVALILGIPLERKDGEILHDALPRYKTPSRVAQT